MVKVGINGYVHETLSYVANISLGFVCEPVDLTDRSVVITAVLLAFTIIDPSYMQFRCVLSLLHNIFD